MESERDTKPQQPEVEDRATLALQAMLAQVLLNLMKGHEAAKRAAARAAYKHTGETEVPELDDKPLGTVKLKNGAARWGTDAGWVDYCSAFYPEHVVEVVTYEVSPAFTAEMLAAHKKGDTVVRFDTGEEVTLSKSNRLPGVTYSEATPTLEVRPNPEATELVLAQLGPAAALLGLAPQPQLEAGADA